MAVVRDAAGRTIGWGLVSDGSAIRVRLLAAGEPDGDLDALLGERIDAACALRTRLFPRPAETNVYRLVHAEGDGLPGLVVDRVGDVLVAQFATGPMHRRRARLAERLLVEIGAASLLARPAGYEAEEGIARPPGGGVPVGAEVPDRIRVVEDGMVFEVEPREGQKTGHYADQRENRFVRRRAVRGPIGPRPLRRHRRLLRPGAASRRVVGPRRRDVGASLRVGRVVPPRSTTSSAGRGRGRRASGAA